MKKVGTTGSNYHRIDELGGMCILPISLHHHRPHIVSFLCLTAHLANPPLAPYV